MFRWFRGFIFARAESRAQFVTAADVVWWWWWWRCRGGGGGGIVHSVTRAVCINPVIMLPPPLSPEFLMPTSRSNHTR